MIEKVKIGGIEVAMEASGDIPRMYRKAFGTDLIVGMQAVEKRVTKGQVDLEAQDIEMFENLAWCFAKHADPDTPDIDTWLKQFGPLDILLAVPELLQIWAANNKSTSKLKKNNEKLTGN